MRRITPLMIAALLSTSFSIGYAATETTYIDLSVIHDEYVKLVGTVVGSDKTFSVDDIEPAGTRGPGPTISLGTMGLETNLTGTCDLDFSSINNFRLRHTTSNRRLTNYRLNYKSNRINRRNRTMSVPCNSTLSSLDFTATGNFRQNVQSGIYSDTVTVVVTTQ